MKNIIKIFIIFSAISSYSFAATEYNIEIKDHKFTPEIIEAKAGEKFILNVKNSDETIEEFESDDLRVEKLVGGGKSIKVKIHALKAGEYEFWGEFHKKTALGKVVVK
jgi:plastocyanin